MRNVLFIAIIFTFFTVALTGCAKEPAAANAAVAIEQSKSKKTPKEQAQYLVDQAKGFINSKNYDQAVVTGQHILSNIDANSKEAQEVIQKATAELKAMAAQKTEELKKSLEGFGKK